MDLEHQARIQEQELLAQQYTGSFADVHTANITVNKFGIEQQQDLEKEWNRFMKKVEPANNDCLL